MLVSRLRHLLFDDKSEYSRSHRDVYEQHIIGDLKYLRAQIDELLQQFPKERRALAMENVNGRSPRQRRSSRPKRRPSERRCSGSTGARQAPGTIPSRERASSGQDASLSPLSPSDASAV
jgi:hypothetical protein